MSSIMETLYIQIYEQYLEDTSIHDVYQKAMEILN